ncbi:MAG TPA: 4-oxalocrotonate decarboxylase [Mycobacteriales bacterium]|nr:4-oxalocrotonate decarboxylase [Mycobacteriales bacterium]
MTGPSPGPRAGTLAGRFAGPLAAPVADPLADQVAGSADARINPEIVRASAVLFGRERDRVPGEPISVSWPCLDIDLAYAVQDQTLRRRLAAGGSLVGVALGTLAGGEPAEPVTGWLTDSMALPIGRPVPHGTLIAASAAPELAFVLASRLAGPGVTAARAMSAVGAVCAAVRVTDSRYRDPEPFGPACPAGPAGSAVPAVSTAPTGPDLAADNAGVAAFVTGPVTLAPSALDLSLEACLLEVDGEVVGSATGAAVPGGQAGALAAAANLLAARGRALEPGWVVLTGMLTDPVPLRLSGVLAVHFTTLGTIVLPAG